MKLNERAFVASYSIQDIGLDYVAFYLGILSLEHGRFYG